MLANPLIMNGDYGGPKPDKGNIINVRDGESLYRQCIKLRRRLSGVPGFRPYLDEMDEREADGADPVSSLWQCFRNGTPLLSIYNASDPEEGDLVINQNLPEHKWGKAAAFLFLKAVMQQMKIPAQDTFSVTELFSDNTTGFVKVITLIDRVLDMLSLSGKLNSSSDSEDSRDGTNSTASTIDAPPKTMTKRQYILRELVETERQYVHHLQNLQALKKELEVVGALTGDSIHNIFLNLNNILDFAQRFLIRVEQQNEMADAQQNWGKMFVHYKDPFRQYEPFIANQRRCETTCNQSWNKMVETSRSELSRQMLAGPTILSGFLLKPFQRLTKYPLLLKDLMNSTPEEHLKQDLRSAIAVIQDVLQQADASIDKETRDDALQDLSERIDDWKSLQIDSFGELLLLGSFTVTKKGEIRSEEKEYHIYLFSRILIMCKDVNAAKAKNRVAGKPALSLKGKPRMSLKGRIFFTNVTNVTPSSSPGHYALQITWKGESANETFLIKFKNDDTLQKWQTMIETQRSSCLMEQKQRGTSDTHFHGLTDLSDMVNPYANTEEDEEDYPRNSGYSGSTYMGSGDGPGQSEFSMSRNASSNSLRSRSATGGSGGSNPHLSAGRPRIPTSEMNSLPPLNTRVQPSTPNETPHGGASYFSPVDRDTPPGSARSSSQSGYAGYHRGVPSMNGYMPREDSYRNTAPAMARNHNSYGVPRQQTRGPSLPPGAIQASNSSSQNRMRSASSPDIHPNVQQNRKYTSSENVPNVPPIPSYVTKQMPPPTRSQSNSPSNGPMPIRTSTPQQYAYSQAPRPAMPYHNYTYDQSYHQDPRKPSHAPSLSHGRPLSPIQQGGPPEHNLHLPSQLKAKVCYDENYVSMIIPSNIQFRSLTDRIDAKLSRFTHDSIASGSVRLRYQDEDGDYILIDSDEGVQEALLDWKESNIANSNSLQNAELILFAHTNGQGDSG